MASYNGRRNAPPAYAAGIEDNNTNNKTHPRKQTLPLLMEGPTVGVAVGHEEPREVQALVSDLILVAIVKERVKASLTVRKWDVCISIKGKVRA